MFACISWMFLIATAVGINTSEAWFESDMFSGEARDVVDCGGNILAGMEVVESPGFPDYYPPDADCLWVISTARGWRINVTSQYFDIEDNAECWWDFVDITDGGIDSSAGSSRYCGNENVSFLSTSDVIVINFQTDASNDGIGFRLVFTPVHEDAPQIVQCNSTVSDATGFLVSPNYPMLYPADAVCYYTIEGPFESHIVLTFHYFEVESTPCDYDHVEIYDGPSTNSELLKRLCGSSLPDNVTSSGHQLLLMFVSDHAVQTQGFNISYVVVHETTTQMSTMAYATKTTQSIQDDQRCSSTFTESEGNFTSPNYPDVYAHNSKCVTHIRATELSTIVLEFLDFDLEDSENCSYDSMVISPVILGNQTPITICGHDLKRQVYTFETMMIAVTFISDTSVNAKGFLVHYIVSPKQKGTHCPLQCNNGGECHEDKDNTTSTSQWRCDCPQGFSGSECQYEVELTCTNHACHNGGTCYIRGKHPACHCMPGYTDPSCQTKIRLASDPVTFTKIPHNMTISRGSSALLECEVREQGVDIIWLHRDRILSVDDHREGIEVHPGGVLYIPEISDEQDGKYTCIALSGGNLSEMSAWIGLTEPCKLRVVKAPVNKTVAEGSSAIFQCFIPDAEHTLWRKDGDIIKFDRRKKKLVNNYLVLDQIMETDEGEYTCSARGANGCTARVSAMLNVEGIGHKKACGRPQVVNEAVRGGRITSGKEVVEGEAPWHVIIREKRHKTAFCGGSLINAEWFITAAHCVSSFEKFFLYPFSRDAVDIYIGTVRCDGRQGIHRRLKKYILHPDYNEKNFDNDVALFQLEQPIEFNDLVMPVCLENERFVNELLLGGRLGVITGCGSLYEDGQSPTFLREVSIPYVNRHVCQRSAQKVNAEFTSGMICAGYSRAMRGDACEGDSGGSYVMRYKDRWVQVGIVSWGVGCDREGQYGYYTHISHFYDWIIANAVENEQGGDDIR